MTNIIEHIKKVEKFMIKDHIKAHTLIIDKDVAKVNGFVFMSAPRVATEVPTMFLGLRVFYEENLSDKVGTPCNFVITDKELEQPKEKTLSDYTTDELLEEIRRRMEWQRMNTKRNY